MRFIRLALAALVMFFATPAMAGETVTYQDGNTTLEGYLVRAQGVIGSPAPVILIVHQWKGLSDYEKMRAEMLSRAGYNAFAIDMYGKGVRPSTDMDAGNEAAKYKNNPALAHKRLQAALDYVNTLQGVNANYVAVIGYCFGGGMALEMARMGAPIKAAISFHGNLASKAPVTNTQTIKAAIQVHHGAADPFVPLDEVRAFAQEMNAAQADWTLTMYSGAVHGFTQKDSGNDPSKGLAYNEKADIRSWASAMEFLKTALYAQ